MQAQNQEIIIETVDFEMPEQRAAYQLFLEYEGLDNDEDAAEQFRENYAGTWSEIEEWAEEFLEDTGGLSQIPEDLRRYFDYHAWARDMEMGGDIWTGDIRGQVAVFFNR